MNYPRGGSFDRMVANVRLWKMCGLSILHTFKRKSGVISIPVVKGLLLCWLHGSGETGKGREDEVEADYPGEDVAELVNLRGDQTTTYKLADGTYMDRIERRFTYNGTDTWTDEDGIEWNVVMNKRFLIEIIYVRPQETV